MDGFLKYLISKFGELFSLLWYYVNKWIDRKIPVCWCGCNYSITHCRNKISSDSYSLRLKTGCKGVYIFISFCSAVYQINRAEE